ncbi:MAG: hypothetical protein U9Q90_00070 [Campylobacterota bacterium]|nr:hypothetical protein [Campylobacterota bacterium]
MQMVKKIILALFVILLSLMIFAPKRELYYLLEAQLMQQDIIIHNEEIDAGLFSLTLKHPELYVKGIRVAQVDEATLRPLLFYTVATVKGVQFDRTLERWVSGGLTKITASHLFADPMHVNLSLSGAFGKAEGSIDLDSRSIHLDLTEEQKIGKLKSMLKKGEEGWYYETSF